jgi:hypothetical protein
MNDLHRNHQLYGLDKKNKRRKPEGLRQFFTLCNHYTTLRGVNETFSRVYLPNKTNGLREKGDAQGLDKFLRADSRDRTFGRAA